MADFKLNDEQLQMLIGFIDSRGFHDPGVITDILDHFACKVEEKMAANPKLTLEDAMYSAHTDFGTLGFYPLQAAYETNTNKKYKTLYRTERNKVLKNPVHMIFVLLSGFVFWKAYCWADTNALLWDTNVLGLLVFAAFIAIQVYFSIKFNFYKRKNKLGEKILFRDYVLLAFLTTIAITQTGNHPAKTIAIPAAICTFTYCLLLIRSRSVYATLKIGMKEINLVYDFLEQKK